MKLNTLALSLVVSILVPAVSHAVGLYDPPAPKTTLIRGAGGPQDVLAVTTFPDGQLKFEVPPTGDAFDLEGKRIPFVELMALRPVNMLVLETLKKAALRRNVLRHAGSTIAAGCGGLMTAYASVVIYVNVGDAWNHDQWKTVAEALLLAGPIGGVTGLGSTWTAALLWSKKIVAQKQAIDAVHLAASTYRTDVTVKQTIPELIDNLNGLIESQR